LFDHAGQAKIMAEAMPLSRLCTSLCSSLRQAGKAVLGIVDDGRRQRRGGTTPFAGSEPRRQIALDFRRPHGGRDGEQSAGNRHVPPHQRLAVGDEPRPGGTHGHALEDTDPAVVALLGPARRLARRPFQQARGQPRAGRRPWNGP
jgi:hypothetical protein